MLKNRLSKIFLCLTLGFVFVETRAQLNFRYVTLIEEIKESGFYQIDLIPSVIAKLQPELQDLRIINAKDRQVPYLLQSSKSNTVIHDKLIDLPIVSNKIETDKQTHIIIENSTKLSVTNLVLQIKNTEATRTITISGSDNQREWYIIKENLILHNLYSDTVDTFMQEVFFPNSNYKYFKIIIQGKGILPLNITRISAPIDNSKGHPGYNPIPSPQIYQKDSSDGHSYITLRFADFYWINRLTLQVEGTKFFRRDLTIYDDKKYKTEQRPYLLSSNGEMVYSTEYKTDQLLLKIKNDDNPPLRLTGVVADQLNRSLITWLEKGNGYRMVFGDSLAPAPQYDLSFFKDSIQEKPLLLLHGKIERNNILLPEKADNPLGNKIWMWVIIFFVLCLLLFFTFRMTKEIGNKS